MSSQTLVERMQKLLAYYPSSDHERAEFQGIISDVRELQEAARVALSNLRRNLASEESTGQPFMGDDEHEAIRVLTAALTKTGAIKGDV